MEEKQKGSGGGRVAELRATSVVEEKLGVCMSDGRGVVAYK